MDGLLAAAREVLGMELAYLAELSESELVLREVDGDVAAYGGVGPGFTLPRELLVVPRDGRGRRAPARARCRGAAAGRRPSVHRRDGDPRIRGRAGAPRRRHGLRLAVLPEPPAAAAARRARPALPRRAGADRGRPAGRCGGRAAAPPRRGRGGRGAGAAGGAQRARELHRCAFRGGARAGARGRERARDGRRGVDRRSARSRCCTTSARSACPTRSCRSPAG